jgi:hypothetical protein
VLGSVVNVEGAAVVVVQGAVRNPAVVVERLSRTIKREEVCARANETGSSPLGKARKAIEIKAIDCRTPSARQPAESDRGLEATA